MEKLTAYKITCANGYSWKTNMSAQTTLEHAKKYFIGSRFNTSEWPEEVMSEAVSVEEITALSEAKS